MHHTAVNDADLISRIRSGETGFYRQLVEKYQDYVYTISYRVLGHPEEAEEASQDTFLKVYQGLSRFQGNSKFTTWLYRIALNTAISRKRKKRIPVERLEDYKIIGDGEIRKMRDYRQLEQRKFIQLAFNKMLPDDVSVLTLFYFKELSLDEMSDITGINVNTLKVKLYRARRRLSDHLTRILNEEVTSLL